MRQSFSQHASHLTSLSDLARLATLPFDRMAGGMTHMPANARAIFKKNFEHE
jgi:hypothetical protein